MQPELTITFNPDGTVQVRGPLNNKVLCYGMLEAARDAVRDFEPQNHLVAAPASVLAGVAN